MATRVSYDRAVNKILAIGKVLHRPLRDVLDSGAKTVAINCARATQPFGTGDDAKKAGEKAVARDIAKVYATPGRAWESISNTFARAQFWKAYKNGDIDVAQHILWAWSSTFNGVLMERFDGGRKHQAARSTTTGRVLSTGGRPAVVVTNPEKLAKYVEKEQDKVGTGKGGWADVARALGSTPRGLRAENDITANWITRKGHGYGSAVHGGSDEHPTIRITNRIPYADHILQGTAKAKAIEIGHNRMIENLQHAVDAETRKLRSAA